MTNPFNGKFGSYYSKFGWQIIVFPPMAYKTMTIDAGGQGYTTIRFWKLVLYTINKWWGYRYAQIKQG